MPWQKTRADRQRDARVYGAPEYRRNRPIAMRRDNYRCQLRYDGCAGAASQCDHIVRPEDGGTGAVENLRAVCRPCHARRTGQQGRGAQTGQQATDPEPRSHTRWLLTVSEQ